MTVRLWVVEVAGAGPFVRLTVCDREKDMLEAVAEARRLYGVRAVKTWEMTEDGARVPKNRLRAFP